LLAKYNLLLAQVGQPTGAAAVCFTTDLQQGMTSDNVKNLQIKLGVTPTSGYFGPITLAAVKTFQTAHGIINTGYVGTLTRGALNALYCTPVVSYPAGCTSAVGFSTTTGLSCSGVVTYPAGCTSAVGFSSTTGLSCAGTTTTTVVAATEGTLTVTQYTIPASATVTVYGGGTNKEVSAYKMKATGSDIRVKRVLVQVGMGATDFPWRDLSSISLWDGSTLLKEVAVNSTNLTEVTWGTTYQLSFDGLDFLLAKDAEKIISLKVSALAVPQYRGANGITTLIPANGVRGVDTTNLNVYGPATASTAYTFYTAAADTPSITLSAAIDNPLGGNVIASKTATTRVDLLKFNVKVETIAATFKSGTITVDSNGTTALSAVELYDGTTLLASAATATTTAADYTWSTFTLPVSAGTTKTLTVKGVMKASPTDASAVGVTVKAAAGLTGIDANGAALVTTAYPAIAGNTMYAYTVAPTFAYVSHSVTIKDSSTTSISNIGDTAITFSVTANGGDIYIPTVGNATSGKKAGVISGIDEKITPAYSAVNQLYATSTTWTCSSPAVSVTDLALVADQLWRVPSGATANCTLSTLVNNYHAASTTVGYFSVAVEYVKWYTTATSTEGAFVDQTWGLTNIKTPDFYLYK
jgi:hypothetical protein